MFHTIKLTANRIFVLVNVAVALTVLFAVFAYVNWHQRPEGFGEFLAFRVTIKNLIVTGLFMAICGATFRAFGLTTPMPVEPFRKELPKVIKACLVSATFACVFPLTSSSGSFSGQMVFYFFPLATLACLGSRYLARICTRHVSRTLHRSRNVIIIGSGPRAAHLYERLCESAEGHSRVLGFVDSPNGHPVTNEIRTQLLGSLEQLDDILMRHAVDQVLIALPAKSCYAEIETAIKTCERAGVDANYLFDIFPSQLARPKFVADDETQLVTYTVTRDAYHLAIKRLLDIVGASVGLVILAPLMIVVAAAIALTSPGQVLFSQERYGLRKRRFRMYKFRTMVKDADRLQHLLEERNEKSGPIFKIKDDPRITTLGRLLRISSIDELPQLVNVLAGDMSLVGPRPMSVRDVSRFDDLSLMRRFSVKPGLTCLWQVNGRSDTDFLQWIALDLTYIDTWSLTLDLQILLKTIPAVLTGKGAA